MVVSDRLGLSAETSDAMHAAAVKRAQSHARVLEALSKAGATEDTIRRVKEAHERSSVGSLVSNPAHARVSAPVGGRGGYGRKLEKTSPATRHTLSAPVVGHINGDANNWEAAAQAEPSRSSPPRSGPVDQMAGIGAHLERMTTGEHMIVLVKEGGPAAKAGILVGSIIRAVNGGLDPMPPLKASHDAMLCLICLLHPLPLPFPSSSLCTASIFLSSGRMRPAPTPSDSFDSPSCYIPPHQAALCNLAQQDAPMPDAAQLVQASTLDSRTWPLSGT